MRKEDNYNNLMERERAVARQYTPFKDGNPPNYLRFGRKVCPECESNVTRVRREIGGNMRTIEYRGNVPGGCAVVETNGVISPMVEPTDRPKDDLAQGK